MLAIPKSIPSVCRSRPTVASSSGFGTAMGPTGQCNSPSRARRLAGRRCAPRPAASVGNGSAGALPAPAKQCQDTDAGPQQRKPGRQRHRGSRRECKDVAHTVGQPADREVFHDRLVGKHQEVVPEVDAEDRARVRGSARLRGLVAVDSVRLAFSACNKRHRRVEPARALKSGQDCGHALIAQVLVCWARVDRDDKPRRCRPIRSMRSWARKGVGRRAVCHGGSGERQGE